MASNSAAAQFLADEYDSMSMADSIPSPNRFFVFYLVDSKNFRTFAPDLVRGGSGKLLQSAARHAEKRVKQ